MIGSSGGNKERSGGSRTGLKRLAATSTTPKAAIGVIIQTIRTSRTTNSHGLQSGLLLQDVTTSWNPGRALLLPPLVMRSQLPMLARRIRNGPCVDSLNS
jgi:hypothetical protein